MSRMFLKMAAISGSEAALGDALLAGIGVGALDRFETIREWLVVEETTEPDSSVKPIYDELFAIYREAYPPLQPTMTALSGRPTPP